MSAAISPDLPQSPESRELVQRLEAIDAAKPLHPFPISSGWELTEANAHRLDDLLDESNLRKLIARALASGQCIDASADEVLLLYYDLKYWGAWYRRWMDGECRLRPRIPKPPDLDTYLLGRPSEEGNRRHWGSLGREIRTLVRRYRAEEARLARERAAAREAHRARAWEAHQAKLRPSRRRELVR